MNESEVAPKQSSNLGVRGVLALSGFFLVWNIITILPHLTFHPLSLIFVIIPFIIITASSLLIGWLIPITRNVGIVLVALGVVVIVISVAPYFLPAYALYLGSGAIMRAGLLIFGTPPGIMLSSVGAYILDKAKGHKVMTNGE